MMKNKKGLSEIISSVLLILVVIAAIGLIAGFVIPMIKDNLSGSQSCFDLNEYFKVDIANSCYNDEDTLVVVERGMQNLSVQGFLISIKDSNGESTSYKIIPGTVANVEMASSGSDTLVVPGPGESKKYDFTAVSGNEISIAPLQKNGKTCTASKFVIESC